MISFFFFINKTIQLIIGNPCFKDYWLYKLGSFLDPRTFFYGVNIQNNREEGFSIFEDCLYLFKRITFEESQSSVPEQNQSIFKPRKKQSTELQEERLQNELADELAEYEKLFLPNGNNK